MVNRIEKFYTVLTVISLVALTLTVIWVFRPQPTGVALTPQPPVLPEVTGSRPPEAHIPPKPVSQQVTKPKGYDLQPGPELQAAKGSISGKVSDSEGNTLAAARVSVMRNMSIISSAITDSEGKYCAVKVPPGTYDVIAECKGFAKGGRGAVSVPEDAQITSIDITLIVGGTFCGQVTTLEGGPIKGAQVRIYSIRQPQERESTAEEIWREPRIILTDPEGKFSLESIAPGEYEANAAHAEYLPGDKRNIRIEAEKAAETKFLLELGGEISGTVTNGETGEPVENAQVFLAAADNTLVLARGCVTDLFGIYRLTGLESRTVNLRVIAQGYISETRQNINVLQGRKIEEIDFALNRGAFVSGTVLSESGRPIAGATVSSTDATSYAITTTDGEGKFKLEGLSGGQVAVAARASGYSLLVQRGIEPYTQNLTLTLRRAGTVSGRLITEAPLPEFVIIIYAPPPQPGKPRTIVAQAISRNAQGAFTVQDVPPGRYTVEVRVPGYTQTTSPEVTVRAGETTTGVEMFLEKSAQR